MLNDNSLDAKIEDVAKKYFWDYEPYDKQKSFYRLGQSTRERVLAAGNQLGKTLCAAYECAFHATGLYPDWWQGRMFNHPTKGWVSSNTSESTRDNAQRKLFGDVNSGFKNGIIHPSHILDYSKARGVPDFLDSIWIKCQGKGTSEIQFKSYERGREKWQGATLDYVWFDEEPPMDIYMEGLSRTNASNGFVFLSFTPLLGMSDVVMRFWKEKHQDRELVMMGMRDVKHFSEEQKTKIIGSYPEHERQARVEGLPILGSGRVFPVAREAISCIVPELGRHWVRIAGIDFGWDHPTAVVWLAWNRDSDVIYVYDCYRMSQTDVMTHAGIIRAHNEWIPMAWPHDGLQHDKGSGLQLAAQYKKYGVHMLPNKAEFSDGSNGVEAGLSEMLDRMRSGRLKIATHLDDWFQEFELYHRDNGKLVKERDDLISATRYAMMCLRYAITEPREVHQLYDPYSEDDKNIVGGY